MSSVNPSTHHIPIHAQGYGSICIADGIHAEALGLAQAGGQPVARAALEAFLMVSQGEGGGGVLLDADPIRSLGMDS